MQAKRPNQKELVSTEAKASTSEIIQAVLVTVRPGHDFLWFNLDGERDPYRSSSDSD
jgi:hypothetical protein